MTNTMTNTTVNASFFSSAIIVDSKRHTITITKKFETAARHYGSEEYYALQTVTAENRNYRIVTRKVKQTTDRYKGLTFDFMKKYIASHDNENKSIMNDFLELTGTSDDAKALGIGSESYGKIKEWFLNTYPVFDKYCEQRENILSNAKKSSTNSKITNLPKVANN